MGSGRCLKQSLYLLLSVICLLSISPLSPAADVPLAWDPSTSPDISGYKVYCGNGSRNYGVPITIGNQTTYTVTGLGAGTWYFAVTAFDISGSESDFSNEVSQIINSPNPPADTAPPVISGVISSSVSSTGATINWATNEVSDSQVEYGKTTSYGSSTALNNAMVTSHSQALSGLSAGTLYHYRVKSKDAAGNLAVSGNYTFTTSAPADTTPPVISGVTSSGISGTGATINWTTNEASDSQVEYGTTASYGSSTALNNAMATSHAQALSGLSAGTLYHYRVKSKDADGNLAISGDYTFTTSSSLAPVITDVAVTNITSRGATITWSTDKSSDSVVEYQSTSPIIGSAILRTPVTKHSITLNQLTKLTLYRFRVKSTDAQGNQSVSPEFSFTTTRYGAPPFAWPRFSAAQNVLGIDTMVGIALANLEAGPVTLTFTAVEDNGNPASSGQDGSSSITRTLNSQAQLPIIDWQIFGNWLSGLDSNGWIKLQSTADEARGFFLIFDSDLNLMDGANFTDTQLTDFALTEIQTDGYNKIDIINANPEDVDIKLELVGGDGTVRASQSRVIKSNGALIADLFKDLFVGIQPLATDYVRVKASKGVQTFHVMRQKSGDISTLSGQDITANGTTLYSPQYVLGGPYRTSLSVVNLDAIAGKVTFRFIREDGAQMGSTKTVTIAGNGKLYIDDPGFFLALDPAVTTAGYVEIESDGIRLAGNALFGDINRQSFSSALALISGLQTSVLFSHVASSDMYFTNIAIVNPNPIGATVTLELHAADGALMDTKREYIDARNRTALPLTQYFPSLEGKNQTSGYIRLFSDHPVASFAVFGTNNLSALSAIPPQIIRSAPEKDRAALYSAVK